MLTCYLYAVLSMFLPLDSDSVSKQIQEEEEFWLAFYSSKVTTCNTYIWVTGAQYYYLLVTGMKTGTTCGS